MPFSSDSSENVIEKCILSCSSKIMFSNWSIQTGHKGSSKVTKIICCEIICVIIEIIGQMR